MSAILEIAGRRFTWAEIDAIAKGEALVEHTETLSPKVKGEGVRVGALLARVTASFPVTHVMLHDDGEYRACLTKQEAVESAVLAHRLDGAPLPDAMGGPLRLLVPASANACLSVKRVTRIVLLDHAEPDTVPRPTTPLRKP
jgi:DMSO/TMAO reductase YedYZ molybdopterin-dependent catalytic subunit